ncbi:helicase with zinc finger domain 2 isoform X1 [Nematostella vectensis]|uniref:helicase with zinc finger domain 2 isoform X1 n=1 Tax=Nematostella vectensis TaxID=45351 RepID=UPI00207750AE|nr:helicase with zinc finger domain 2 isoform X1 [Nematostella vectensis]
MNRFPYGPVSYGWPQLAFPVIFPPRQNVAYQTRQRSPPAAPNVIMEDGVCSHAHQLLQRLEDARKSGVPETSVIAEMSSTHNIQCSEKLFIPHIGKSKLVSWIFTVTPSHRVGPFVRLKQVYTLDPLLPEFSITHITQAGYPTTTLPQGCQLWQAKGTLHASAYQITVQFISSNYGNFNQRLVFDFGDDDGKAKIVRHLGVLVAPETSLVHSLEYKAPCDDDSELIWLSKYTLIPFDESTNMGASRAEHPLPPNMKSTIEYGAFDHLEASLTPDNYHHRLHTLLFIEEFERRRQLTRLNLHSKNLLVCIKKSIEDDSQVTLVLPIHPTLVEDANILISRSARALLRLHLPGARNPVLHEVVVEALRKDGVVLQLSRDLQRVLKTSKKALPGDICFRFVDTYQYMHRAIDLIDLACIFPNNKSGERVEWQVAPHPILNKPQATALSHILDPRPRPPLLIFGPFGTGKTRTIAEAVKELCRLHAGNTAANLRILICTHSNSAADHYIVDYLHPFVTSSEIGPFLCRPLRICWEHRFLSSVSHTVLKYCLIDRETGRFAIPSRQDIDCVSVIVTTLVTADVLVKMGLPSGYFSHVFIDEAAQAMEAETLIPLCLTQQSTRIVLAGDHLQMGAHVFSPVARRLCLDRSLLVRLYELYPRESDSKLLLLENYRAYNDIVEIPSKLFYEGTLIAHKHRPEGSEYPIRFHGVLGREERAVDRASYYNMAEAAEVSERVEELVKQWRGEDAEDVELRRICVLTPYTAQVREIRQLLRRSQLGEVRVESVNNVQGLEFDALFISTVHTAFGLTPEMLDNHHLGFLSDPRLLNTAVTRAKYHLTIVGDPNALCGAGKCKACWKIIFSKCSEHGTFNYRLPFDKVMKSLTFPRVDDTSTSGISIKQQKPLTNGADSEPRATQLLDATWPSLSSSESDRSGTSRNLGTISNASTAANVTENGKETSQSWANVASGNDASINTPASQENASAFSSQQRASSSSQATTKQNTTVTGANMYTIPTPFVYNHYPYSSSIFGPPQALYQGYPLQRVPAGPSIRPPGHNMVLPPYYAPRSAQIPSQFASAPLPGQAFGYSQAVQQAASMYVEAAVKNAATAAAVLGTVGNSESSTSPSLPSSSSSPPSSSGSKVDSRINDLVKTIACSISRRRTELHVEQSMLRNAIDNPGRGREHLKMQLEHVEKELDLISCRTDTNNALASLLGIDCGLSTAASDSNNPGEDNQVISGGQEEWDTGEENLVSQTQINDNENNSFLSTSSNGENVRNTHLDADTKEWFQSRQDDPLVQEYIKAFEKLMMARSSDSHTTPVQSDDDNKDNSRNSMNRSLESSTSVVPNWLLQPSSSSFYLDTSVHEEYLSDSATKVLLKGSALLLCVLEINGSTGGTTALAKVNNPDIPDVLIRTRAKMNRAFHGDLVAVRVMDSSVPEMPIGKVVSIVEEIHPRQYLCIADSLDTNIMTPINSVNPRVVVLQSKNPQGRTGFAVFELKDGESQLRDFVTEAQGKLFLVQVMEWGASFRYPLGIVRQCFQEVTSLETALPAFAADNGLQLVPARMGCFNEDWTIPDTEWGSRLHFSEALTIDCGKTMELDDALSVKAGANGVVSVGVHVADVSYFISKDSSFDQAAFAQGTSAYPTDGSGIAVNMLPEQLRRLCSLLPGKHRLAISVIFTFNTQGRSLRLPEVRRSIVSSKYSLTFDQCDAVLNGQASELPESVKRDIHVLGSMSRKLYSLRTRQGCLAGLLDAVRATTFSKSSQIVEQLMIFANTAVAEKLLKSGRTKDLTPLRTQSPPKSHILQSWSLACERAGILPESSLTLRRVASNPSSQNTPSTVSVKVDLLGKISTAINAKDITLLTESLAEFDTDGRALEAHCRLSSLQERSQYVLSSKVGPAGYGHFTLGLDAYTHFTSPLRRYFDIVVQRMLVAVMLDEELPYTADELEQICSRCQTSKVQADTFERSCKLTNLAAGLSSSPQWTEVVVHRVTPDKIRVSLPSASHSKTLSLTIRTQDLKPSDTDASMDEELVLSWDVQEFSCGPSSWPPHSRSHSSTERCFELPATLWCSFVSAVAREDVNRIQALWNKIPNEGHILNEKPPTSPEMTSRSGQPFKRFTKHIKAGDRLRVVMGSTVLKSVLQPVIQGVQVLEDVYRCTVHMHVPAKCFGFPRASPTLTSYSSAEEYRGVMQPLLELEEATCCLSDGSRSTLLRGVTLSFGRVVSDRVDSTMRLPRRVLSPGGRHVQAGDYLCIRPRRPNRRGQRSSGSSVFHARVHHVEGASVHVDIPRAGLPSVLIEAGNCECDIEVTPRSGNHRQIIKAVCSLSRISKAVKEVVLGRKILARQCETNVRVVPGLDDDQAHAVRTALTHPLTMVYGQPGTGKSWTAVAIACHFVNQNRADAAGHVLLCAPTERALDVVSELLLQVPGIRAVRIYSKQAETTVIDGSGHSNLALHMRVRHASNPHSKALLSCEAEISRLTQELTSCTDPTKQERTQHKLDSKRQKYNTILATAEGFELGETPVDIIICTCAEAGSQRMRTHANIAQCIVDESNYCLEPEVLVPAVTAGPRCSRFVLVGDHKQLVPVLQSKEAWKLGLGRSLFEDLWEAHREGSSACCTLNTQHRMHPSLGKFSSSFFYNVQQSRENVSNACARELEGFWPAGRDLYHVFCHVDDEPESDCDYIEGGMSNDAEVQKVVEVVESLMSRGVQPFKIWIVSPFVRQRHFILHALDSTLGSQLDIRLTSPEECQGAQCDVLVLSTVRGRPRDQLTGPHGGFGCLGDKHQMNVVLTRARKGLVIVGNRYYLSGNPMWNRLIHDYEVLDCVVEAADWP